MKHEDIDHTGLTGVGGVASGTSFPGSPTAGDLLYRTDRNLLYFYDGTRWLTTTLYSHPLGVGNTVTGAVVATTNVGRMAPDPDYDLWVEDFICDTHVLTTNDGSNFWTLVLNKVNAANSATAIATRATSADAASTWVNAAVAVDAVVDRATYKHLTAIATKTASGGTLTFAVGIKYRLIG